MGAGANAQGPSDLLGAPGGSAIKLSHGILIFLCYECWGRGAR